MPAGAVYVASVVMIRSSLLDADRVLGAVGDGQAGLVRQVRRHRPVTDDHGLAVVVDVEQLGSEGVAAVVALALVRLDDDLHPLDRTPRSRRSGSTIRRWI